MHDSDPTFSKGQRSFVTYRIARVQNRLNAQASALLRAHCELSLTEWRVISLAHILGETTATAMAKEVEMDKGQISRAIKGLTAAGHLIASNNKKDARQSLLRLSDSGAALYERLISVMLKRQQDLTADIDDDELDAFYRVLNKLGAKTSMHEE